MNFEAHTELVWFVVYFSNGNILKHQFNPLSPNHTKWLNTLKQFVLSEFDHFVGLALKGLSNFSNDNKLEY